MAEQNVSEKSIFHAALELESASQRRDYLEQACKDNPQLRAEIEGLIEAHLKPGDFLDQPPVSALTVDEPIAEGPGTTIGPYKLLEQIGEGGMGVVFMAEQTEPVRRKVALKIIKPGMDSKQVIARFEAERQALALMDHPNVARIYDAGSTTTSRPYFVMELVRGAPITKYCDEQELTTRQRLELFRQVCQAIQHAHQKGIIHRDVKPSNVIVSSHDGTPVVKVIDFGIAKAISEQLTDKTVHTGFVQFVGTPLYVSPEQAGVSDLDVDTRSDVYSLGVLLYELLTGTTPFEKESLLNANFDEMLRIIREDEPPRPSSRVSTLAGKVPSAVSERRGAKRRLSKQLRGELDWIVMRALEKDRKRRYQSANAFSADVARFLNDEPVHACPPSVAYRARKVIRRNKIALITAALVLFVLLAGTVVSTWLALKANKLRVLADERYQNERNARSEANTLRGSAEENLQATLAFLKKTRRRLGPFERQSVFNQGLLDLVRQLEPQGSVDTHRAIGDIYYVSLDYAHAVRAYTEALRLDPKNASLLVHRGDSYYRWGNYPAALRDYSSALRFGPDTLDAHVRRGFALFKLDKLEKAIASFAIGLKLNPATGARLLTEGFLGSSVIVACADEEFRTRIVALANNAIDSLDVANINPAVRGDLLAGIGRYADAYDEFHDAIEAGNVNQIIRNKQALCLLAQGNFPGYRKYCASILQKHARTNSTAKQLSAGWTCSIAPNAVLNYSDALSMAERGVNTKLRHYRAAKQNFQVVRLALANHHRSFGALLYRACDFAHAQENLYRAIELKKPGMVSTAYARYFLAMTQHKLKRTQSARTQFNEAAQWTRFVLDENPNNHRVIPWDQRLTLVLLHKEADELLREPRD